MNYPFARPKPNPRRREPRRIGDRVRLDREGIEALRIERWELDGRCCVVCGKPLPLDGDLQTRAHLAHVDHGSRKTDTIDGTRTKCYECHIVKEHGGGGGKPCARKPGRKMNKKEAEEHWKGTICAFCKGEKSKDCTFCNRCWCKLSPQVRHDLLHTNCTDDYLQAVADAETELLAHEAEGGCLSE